MDTSIELLDLLRSAATFRDFTDEELEYIQQISHINETGAGEVIFHQGSSSSELYLVANGEVDILVDQSLVSEQTGQEQLTIATVRRGETFGEISLVDEGTRSAAAQSALPETLLVVIPQQDLTALCDEHPRLGYKLMRNLAQDLALTIRTRTTDIQILEWLTWPRNYSAT